MTRSPDSARRPPLNGKTALITGITGQDGSYLAELLLEKGYLVAGVVRRSSTFNTARIDHLYQDVHEEDVRLRLHFGDLGDSSALHNILQTVAPQEVYHLGAQSHVKVSFDTPEHTGNVAGLGTVRMLEAIRSLGLDAKFLQASSSEMFGQVSESPQRETTQFHPRSPYGAAKAYAYYMTCNYRESYGMFAGNAIMFNHESPRRGETFVTRKISRAATRIKCGLQTKLYLGNLEAQRDWGFAGDYVEAMWLVLQAPAADDFVIATGVSHTVREFCEYCFEDAGLPLTWYGAGLEEVGCGPDGRELVAVDPRYFRPAEVDTLRGDASKAARELGWKPRVSVRELASMMVASDLKLAEDELAARVNK